METQKLKQSYKNLLVRAGVDFHRAEHAVKNMTREELQLIYDTWPEWAVVLPRSENEMQASADV